MRGHLLADSALKIILTSRVYEADITSKMDVSSDLDCEKQVQSSKDNTCHGNHHTQGDSQFEVSSR